MERSVEPTPVSTPADIDLRVRRMTRRGFTVGAAAAGAGFLGWFGDGHPQLPLGHRSDQVPVLDRAGQLRVVGAAGLKIGANPQHHQCRWGLIWAVPGGGGRVQRGDERPPLPFLGALSEQLLELVDHQQQPARPSLIWLCRAAIGFASRPGCWACAGRRRPWPS